MFFYNIPALQNRKKMLKIHCQIFLSMIRTNCLKIWSNIYLKNKSKFSLFCFRDLVVDMWIGFRRSLGLYLTLLNPKLTTSPVKF